MKHILIVVLLLFAFQVNAQDRRGKIDRMQAVSAEEMAEVETKKMTLDLDLTAEQQMEVKKLNLENAQYKKEKMAQYKAQNKEAKELSTDARLKMKNDMLDSQLKTKTRLKEILDEKQYKKWETSTLKKQEMRKKSYVKNRKNLKPRAKK